MVNAVLDGKLKDVPTWTHPVFGVAVPESCPRVPTEMLNPRNTWRDSAAYDTEARKVAGLFQANFEKFASEVSADIAGAGPLAG
jgi:phosphoenolpyruvate carboxykinase (ATP)